MSFVGMPRPPRCAREAERIIKTHLGEDELFEAGFEWREAWRKGRTAWDLRTLLHELFPPGNPFGQFAYVGIPTLSGNGVFFRLCRALPVLDNCHRPPHPLEE